MVDVVEGESPLQLVLRRAFRDDGEELHEVAERDASGPIPATSRSVGQSFSQSGGGEEGGREENEGVCGCFLRFQKTEGQPAGTTRKHPSKSLKNVRSAVWHARDARNLGKHFPFYTVLPA